MRSTVDVLGVGVNSVDYVYRVPAFPRPDSELAKLRISSHLITCGGQTTTTLCTCSALGLSVSYIGVTGNDEAGRLMRQELSNRNVDLTDACEREVANAFAVILLDERAGERIVLWSRTPELGLRPADIDPAAVHHARLVHVDDADEDAAMTAARIGRATGIPVTSDIERVTSRTEELVDTVTVPIFAEHALEPLTGQQDFEQALRRIRRRHAGLLCATLGARGAMMLDGDRLLFEPAFDVQSVDTTGAGDVFRGALIAGLLRGDAPSDVLRFATAAAAVSCTRVGAIASVPTVAEVEWMLETREGREGD